MAKWHIATPDYADPVAVACGRRDQYNRVSFDDALEKLSRPHMRGTVCRNCIKVLRIDVAVLSHETGGPEIFDDEAKAYLSRTTEYAADKSADSATDEAESTPTQEADQA